MGDVQELQKLLNHEKEKNRELETKLKELQEKIQHADKQEALSEDLLGAESQEDNSGQDFSREYHKFYQIFFEKSIDALFVTTTDGRFVDANQAMLDLFHYTKDDLKNLNADQIYPKKQDRTKYRELIEKDGFVENYDVVLKKKNGELVDCLETATIWRKKDGTIGGYQGILRDITKQKQMERELLSGKRHLEQLFQNLPDAVVLADNTGKIQRINKTFTKIFGYTEEEAIGKFLDELVVPKELFEEGSGITKRTYQGETVYLESVRKRKDRTLFDVAILSAPFIVNENERAVYTVYRDNTERKQMEREIIKEKAYFEKLFEYSPEAVALCDNNNRGLRVNKTFTTMFGYTQEEAVGKSVDELIVPEELKEEGSDLTNKTADSETISVETIRKRKDGKRFDVVILGAPFTINENEKAIYAIYRDNTAHKQAEEVLRESEARYRTLVDNIPQKIFIKSRDHKYVSINERYARDLGIKPEDAFGKDDYDFFPKELADKYWADDKMIMETGQTEGFEERYLQEGKESWVYTVKTPVRDKHGKIDGVLGIFFDITERKRAERIQNALYNILDASTRAVTMADLLKMIHNTVGTLMDAKNFSVALYDEKTNLYSFSYHIDKYDSYIPDTPVSLDGGVADFVRKSKKPLLLNKEQYKEFTRKKGIQFIGKPAESWMGVPLISGNSAVGVAEVTSYTNPDAYTQDDLIIFSFISGHIGLVIERKRAEEALKESEEKFRVLFENARDGILICDPKTMQFISANRKMCEFLECSIDDIKNLTVSDIHPKQELPDVIEKFKKIVLEEKSFVQNIPLLSKKGKITYMDVNGYNIIINGIECLVGVFRDATERIKLEQERLNRSKLDAVHNMIVTINHEMNQPLSVIKSYSDFLMKDIRADSSVRDDVEIIYQETEKLAQLVKKMSSLKRIKFSEYSPSTQMVDLENEQGDTPSMNAEENTQDIPN